ncbi:phage antirepressor [Rhodococcus opacus]|uniref:Bro-N domain-containing protein n=1 Tax=Rhodococcus opacus (strain B4) TaxID=632772 RepID=C1B9A1_RHOOB|nr:phage antirepressor KilAC domain-containing protein [Rhodococcus opacus]BAH52254.1 hypothetical protein ROP_40070 [Rhodococcus opacus B4]
MTDPTASGILDLLTYEDGNQFRVFGSIDTPQFALADVCTILEIRNSRDAVGRLDRKDVGSTDTLTAGGRQQITVVNESGLYELIFQSRKPEAKRFRRWITTEVLPSIRRTGSYGVPTLDLSSLGPTERAFLAQMNQGLQLALDSAEKNQRKADAFDTFLNGKGCYLIDTVANLIGAKHRALWSLLYDERVLISKGSRRRQPYANTKFDGWFSVKTHDQEKTNGHASHTTYVTPFGAEQIRLLAIDKGLIEPQLMSIPAPSTKELYA